MILSVVLGTFLATRTFSATVNVDLRVDPGGTYELYLDSSLGDNFGIASYGVELANIATLTHTSPRLGFATNAALKEGPAGFTQIRSADNVSFVHAAQLNIPTPTPHIIRGFGQEASSFAAQGLSNFGNPQTQSSWGYPLQIATGTWSGTPPTVIDASVNVYREATFMTPPPTMAADIFIVGGSPAIDVQRNGVSYLSGSSFDFGTVPFTGSTERFFSIRNPGNSLLLLDSPNITGPFSIINTFPPSIAAGESANLGIALDASTAGTFNELLTFGTNVSGLPTYQLQLTGRVLSPEQSLPAIDVVYAGSSVASGSSVSLGTAYVGQIRQRAFTIKNPGLGELVLGAPTFTGGYSLAGSFPSSIPYGEMSNFTIAMDTSTAGTSPGSVSFVTNVTGQPTFDLQLTGEVSELPPPPTGPATVFIDLNVAPGGTYEVTMYAVGEDNAGIRSYVFGLDNWETLQHIAPRVGFAENAEGEEGPAGFTALRSGNNPADNTVRGGQDLLTPHLIAGFGQTDSSFVQEGLSGFGAPQTQTDWGVPLLIAQGTWSFENGRPSFSSSVVAGVNVIDPNSPSGSSAAQIVFVSGFPIPEPSTVVLAALALLGLLTRARRRR
ncbi:MAG: choice-of-anchor D domain-containing protein [Pirellulales bacterium]